MTVYRMLGRVAWSHYECNLGAEGAPSAQNPEFQKGLAQTLHLHALSSSMLRMVASTSLLLLRQ